MHATPILDNSGIIFPVLVLSPFWLSRHFLHTHTAYLVFALVILHSWSSVRSLISVSANLLSVIKNIFCGGGTLVMASSLSRLSTLLISNYPTSLFMAALYSRHKYVLILMVCEKLPLFLTTSHVCNYITIFFRGF